MKQKFICLFMLIPLLAIKVSAQGLTVAREYGESLKQWTATGNLRYRTNIEKICDGKKSTRIADDIAMDLARRNSQAQNISYLLDSYLNWIEKEMMVGLNIECSDYEVEDRRNIEGSTEQETRYAREADKEYVSCRIKVNGSLKYDVYDLICMREGKITKISKFQKIGNKIKVDFSDLVDDDEKTFGVSYNYSQHFPVGVSFTGSWSWFMLSLDLGFNFDDDKTFNDHMEITDFSHYKRTTETFDPKFYLTVTPAIFLKYFSIGCGAGFLYMKGERNIDSRGYGANSWQPEFEKYKFMLRPVVKGYLPLDDEWMISAGVGYDYIFGYKDMNGVNFSLGLNYIL